MPKDLGYPQKELDRKPPGSQDKDMSGYLNHSGVSNQPEKDQRRREGSVGMAPTKGGADK